MAIGACGPLIVLFFILAKSVTSLQASIFQTEYDNEVQQGDDRGIGLGGPEVLRRFYEEVGNTYPVQIDFTPFLKLKPTTQRPLSAAVW
jgi:hypothetical protein